MQRKKEIVAEYDTAGLIRLNKYLSDAGVCSRRQADKLIEEGKVTVDQIPAVTGMRISRDQEVRVEGRKVTVEDEFILLACNKPRGIECTTAETEGNIVDFIQYPKRIYPIGRLDKDSEGLILLTNHGAIVNKILKASNYHEKEYEVMVNRPIDEAFIKKMANGVRIHEIEKKNGEKKKTSLIERFHIAFNAAYDVTLKKYERGITFFIRRKFLSFAIVIATIVVMIFLMNITPTGLVPNEDTGTIFAVVDMAPGTAQERTEAVMEQVDSLVAANPAVKSRTQVTGYSFLAGQGNSYGTLIIKLKDWKERGKGEDANTVIGTLYMQAQSLIKDARVLLFAPPMIPGYSVTNGFEFNLQDKTGGDLNTFYEVAQEFLGKLKERPEIATAQTSFNPTFPQYMIDIDAAKCKQAGISPNDILTTLQGYYGGIYASNFNRFGKLYRVMIQADPRYRINPESLQNVKIRNGNEMAPISQFMTLTKVYGPDNIKRFNMFTSMSVNGSPADGYSSGQAINAIEEVAAQSLPTGYGFEFSGMTREEQSTTAMIFALCFVFVYLLLSAQYESYILPLVVLLSVPSGLMGSFIFAQIMGVENNIYMQIALIMLIGLLAKNAILITEFALDRRKTGMSITEAAVSGASARLRPILMTSLAMVIGLLPLMFAHGVGANGNSTLGTGAIGGMFIGMICQIFIVPALFVVFEHIQEKVKPLEWHDTDNTDIASEIEQYTK